MLKAALHHIGKNYPSVLLVHATNMKEKSYSLKSIITYSTGNICADIKYSSDNETGNETVAQEMNTTYENTSHEERV